MPPPIDPDRIALGVRQPWAELILQGAKTLEIRSTEARVRGPVYVYASRRPSNLPDAAAAAERFGLDIEALPKGMVLGAVTLAESRRATPDDAADACVGPATLTGRFAWRLVDPVRFAEPVPPRFLPYGVWFYPFRQR